MYLAAIAKTHAVATTKPEKLISVPTLQTMWPKTNHEEGLSNTVSKSTIDYGKKSKE